MATIQDVLGNLKKLKLRVQVPIIIEQNADMLIALNQRQLFATSEDSKGEPLEFYNSNAYAIRKEKQNSLPGFGRPDLYQTGDFYRSFAVKVDKKFYNITATDEKTSELVGKYGKDIFGLNEENKTLFAQESLYKGIKEYIASVTGVAVV